MICLQMDALFIDPDMWLSQVDLWNSKQAPNAR